MRRLIAYLRTRHPRLYALLMSDAWLIAVGLGALVTGIVYWGGQ